MGDSGGRGKGQSSHREQEADKGWCSTGNKAGKGAGGPQQGGRRERGGVAKPVVRCLDGTLRTWPQEKEACLSTSA